METATQFLLTFIGAALFFLYGARSKNLPITWRSAREIAAAALAVVVVFAFLSGGKGCVSASSDGIDCQPGPGIFGTC